MTGRIAAFRPGLQPRLQAGLHELVQVAVQHLLRVAALDAGAQVLDAALVQHVVADLAAPADVGLGLASSASFSALRFCTSSSYSLAASIFIAVSRFWCWLRPVWQATTTVGMWVMRTRRFGLVDVLAAGAEER